MQVEPFFRHNSEVFAGIRNRTTIGQRILTKGRITLYHYWGLNDPFCCVHHSRETQCFWTTRKIAPSCGDLDPYVIHRSYGPTWVHSQTASWSLLPFLAQYISVTKTHTMLHLTSLTIGRIDAVQNDLYKPAPCWSWDMCVYSPKCRHEYSQKDAPKQYRCYCGKAVDPVFDPWLVPHSCGQECGRLLRPDCGHTCHLLCHPGDWSSIHVFNLYHLMISTSSIALIIVTAAVMFLPPSACLSVCFFAWYLKN